MMSWSLAGVVIIVPMVPVSYRMQKRRKERKKYMAMLERLSGIERENAMLDSQLADFGIDRMGPLAGGTNGRVVPYGRANSIFTGVGAMEGSIRDGWRSIGEESTGATDSETYCSSDGAFTLTVTRHHGTDGGWSGTLTYDGTTDAVGWEGARFGSLQEVLFLAERQCDLFIMTPEQLAAIPDDVETYEDPPDPLSPEERAEVRRRALQPPYEG